MTITIHTDGSCETQTRIGAYAAILQCGEHRREITGRAEDVTVNVMELTAVIEALKVLKTTGQTVQVFTDSNYVAKGVNDGCLTGLNAVGKPHVTSLSPTQSYGRR